MPYQSRWRFIDKSKKHSILLRFAHQRLATAFQRMPSLIRMDLLARAALGLGIAISDYNSKLTDNFKEVQDATVSYIAIVKQLRKEGIVDDEKLTLLLSLVGEAWGALIIR